MALTDANIEDLANSPKKLVGDEGSIEEKNVHEMVLADRWIKHRNATAPPFGTRIAKCRCQGTVQ